MELCLFSAKAYDRESFRVGQRGVRPRTVVPRTPPRRRDPCARAAGQRRVRVRQRRPRRAGAHRAGRRDVRHVALRCAGFNHVDLEAADARHPGRPGAGLLAERRRRAHAGADPRPQPPHPPGLQPGARGQLRARRPARLRPGGQDGRRGRDRADRLDRGPAALAPALRRGGVRPGPRCRTSRSSASATPRSRRCSRPATCSA